MSQVPFSSFDSLLHVRDTLGRYRLASADQILESARKAIEQKFQRGASFTSPAASKEYLKAKLSELNREVFAVLFLDHQHRLLVYRELPQVAKDIATATGLEYRPVADGQRVAGIYRGSVMLASRRYAMLDEGMGFSLVPWKPVVEQRLGQRLAATVRGGGVSWEIGRQRGPGIT